MLNRLSVITLVLIVISSTNVLADNESAMVTPESKPDIEISKSEINETASKEPETNDANPIEISADNSLEWDRENKQYIADGNAIAKQGISQIFASKLVADYREDENGKTEIWQLTAFDGVTINHQDSVATGQKAIYLLDEGKAVLIGDNLKLESPEQYVTAKESFTYWIQKGHLNAKGNVFIRQEKNTLEAEQIDVYFTENDEGKRVLEHADATGNVVIITLKEMISGDKGSYIAKTQMAELNGNVRIKRGQNILTGTRATVDLTTNVSKLYGGGSDGRVKGVFYPGSDGFQNITKPKEKTN